MIHFKLTHLDKIQPAGTGSDLNLSWFWLTDGDLWLKIADSTLYEYSTEALSHFGDKESPYNDYPIVRFIEDFTELFKSINESVPEDIYQLTEDLTKFTNDTQKWLDLNDTDEDEHSEFYFEEYDNLISWTYNRSFGSSHLIGGPYFSFFRNKDKIRIIWETKHKLDNGIEIWTAKNGNIEISYIEFIKQVKDFGNSFFSRMKEQVEAAIQKDWKDIQIDKKRLIEEHRERETDFWKQFALLESDSPSKTNWEQIQELKFQMDKEIKTKA